MTWYKHYHLIIVYCLDNKHYSASFVGTCFKKQDHQTVESYRERSVCEHNIADVFLKAD